MKDQYIADIIEKITKMDFETVKTLRVIICGLPCDYTHERKKKGWKRNISEKLRKL